MDKVSQMPPQRLTLRKPFKEVMKSKCTLRFHKLLGALKLRSHEQAGFWELGQGRDAIASWHAQSFLWVNAAEAAQQRQHVLCHQLCPHYGNAAKFVYHAFS